QPISASSQLRLLRRVRASREAAEAVRLRRPPLLSLSMGRMPRPASSEGDVFGQTQLSVREAPERSGEETETGGKAAAEARRKGVPGQWQYRNLAGTARFDSVQRFGRWTGFLRWRRICYRPVNDAR